MQPVFREGLGQEALRAEPIYELRSGLPVASYALDGRLEQARKLMQQLRDADLAVRISNIKTGSYAGRLIWQGTWRACTGVKRLAKMTRYQSLR
jgi:hypothetical protein